MSAIVSPRKKVADRCRNAIVYFEEMSLVDISEIRHNGSVRESRPDPPARQPYEAAMAFNLRLSILLAKMRWKVKIRDKERVEEPHISIIHKKEVWRVGLRDHRFLDGGSWRDMPDGLEDIVRANWEQLCAEWDRMYPHNPVKGEEADNDNENA